MRISIQSALALMLAVGCGGGSVGGSTDSDFEEVRRGCRSADPCIIKTVIGKLCESQPAPDGTACPAGSCIAGTCVATSQDAGEDGGSLVGGEDGGTVVGGEDAGIPPAACSGAGSEKFIGCYYDNADFTGFAFERTDTAIDFDWANASPDPRLGPDDFSIVWQGDFALAAGEYVFTAAADDGIRLYVDGVRIIDEWREQPATAFTAIRPLTAGVHRLRVEYNDLCCLASARVSWALVPPAGETITINPIQLTAAYISNPVKGYDRYDGQGGFGDSLHEGVIDWRDIETSASDTVATIIAKTDQLTAGYRGKNKKLVPLVRPEFMDGDYRLPSDIPIVNGDATYDTVAFKSRLAPLIRKLAQAWDNDPRIAWVESGLIGNFGEQHHPQPSEEIQQIMIDAFNDPVYGFKSKHVTRRYPPHFATAGWGVYWHSYGCNENGLILGEGDYWKRKPSSGEIAYDFGVPIPPTGIDGYGNCVFTPPRPTPTTTVATHADTIEDLIRSFHTSALSWILEAPYDSTTSAGYQQLNRALGYEFYLESVAYPRELTPGASFSVTLGVRNKASAPFYYAWPVELSLHDPATRALVWKQTLAGIDVRTWLPGEGWQVATRTYSSPPQLYTASATVTLSSAPPAGRYILALAVLDPAANLPSVRFATRNYWQGGRHPIGYVGVGTAGVAGPLDATVFDDVGFIDTTLHY